MFIRLCATGLLLAASASTPEGRVDLKAAPAKEPIVSLPVREVTVFSDRARVTRRGEVPIAGHMPMQIALLPPTIDPESLRLEAEGAKVERLEVRRANLDEFPRAEAEQLIRELEAARDAETATHQKMASLESERQLLLSLRPSSSPLIDPKALPVLFEPGGWKASVSFLDAREALIGEALHTLDDKAREQSKKTQQLLERAQLLTGGARVAPGFVVDAWLEGRGSARLSLTYLAANARWYPAYDVRFNPGRAEVEIGFAALATQQTGEDWIDANLVFSTAVPATTATLPKLLAWKIGEREQFIPTPVAKPELAPAPPPASTYREAAARADREDELRARLLALESVQDSKNADHDLEETGKLGKKQPPALALPGERIRFSADELMQMRDGLKHTLGKLEEARNIRDAVRLNCVNEKLTNIKGLLRVAEQADISYRDAIAQRHDQAAERELSKIQTAHQKVQQLRAEADQCVGMLAFETGATTVVVDEPVSVQAGLREEVSRVTTETVGRAPPASSMGLFNQKSVRVEQLPFNSPLGWSEPAYAAELPAALAGGYDFVYPSARAESLRSGPELRRVALHSARFPAEARLAIYPALRKHAYVVADVTNSSDRPLLAGQANLFVGADLQGQARLTTTAVGEKILLPIGVDEGIQIERNVNLVTRETGLISKDDVTTYEVVIELLNSHPTPMQARVVDQIPLAAEKTVELKLDHMEPWAILDKDDGSLEWRLTLAPGVKQVVRFTYTVTRPRGAQLRQW